MYAAYLMLLSQVKQQIHIKVVCEDVEIFIDTFADGGCWQMSARVFNGYGVLPAHVREVLSSMHLFRWQTNGPHLKADPSCGTVDLVGPCMPIKTFADFQKNCWKFSRILHTLGRVFGRKKFGFCLT